MLTQLAEFARKNLADSEPGFTTRNIRWLVEISNDGRLMNLVPSAEDRGEQTPKCPDMHSMNAGGRAHFLVESLQTVALHLKNNETQENIEKIARRHDYFLEMLKRASGDVIELESLSKFLEDQGQTDSLRKRCAEVRAKPSDWLTWRIAGRDPLKQEEVLDWWRRWRLTDQAEGESKDTTPTKMVCFLTGEALEPLATQPKITGLSGVGGLGTGDVMAGFDKEAFCSFGLEQASNAAMGEKPVREYVDALNYLIKNRSHKLANALVVHWFKEAVKPEDDPLGFLFEPPELIEAVAQNSARQLLESLRKGQRPVPGNNRYFAMTVSGAAGRVMVRDWMEGSFEELVARIDRWFSDFEIVGQYNGSLAPAPKFNNVCLSMVRYDSNKSYLDNLKKLPAPTATTLWRVALAGLPFPQPFIAQALIRFRSDIIDDKPFNHARMGLMKAYFIRKGGYHMTAYLNKEHPEPAYHCGRLLAMLARLQRSALGDVGAGVVQRYYVAASQTPGLTLGRLVANAKNHSNKLDGGLSYWYEGQIAEIWSRIKDYVPKTLTLEEQTLFALGYYQQIAESRAKKNTTTNERGAQ